MSYDFEDYAGSQLQQLASGINLVTPSPNQSVFRYVGLNTKTSWNLLEATLNAYTLRGALASSLNDPFELSPCVFDDLRPSVVEAIINNPNPLGDEAEPITEERIRTYRQSATEFLEKQKRDTRIVSFCERSESPLLWSHYAQSYKGACLHFLGGQVLRRPSTTGTKMGRVSYTEHRAIYPLSLALAQTESMSKRSIANAQLLRAESDRLMFFSKATDWAYEKELRIVYRGGKESDVAFNPASLASLIVGPRMESEDRQRLRDLVASSKMPHLRIREARVSENSYSVHIDWRGADD